MTPSPENKFQVCIGVPSYDGKIDFRLSVALARCSEKYPHFIDFANASLLAYTFNMLWCNALNAKQKGVTHFCMVHADVIPEIGFLDKMMEVMQRETATVLSVILPIKNGAGITSTAMDNDEWEPSRFTMKQLADMPATFTHRKLLVNTGLMLVDIRGSWPYTSCFTIHDRITRDKNGKYVPQTQPEDWNFARTLRRTGGGGMRIFATREVKADHVGGAKYPNQGAWGSQAIDEAYGEARLVE